MLSMTVMKANIRRPAELVFMGANGRNTSQVSFANVPTERKKHAQTAFNDAIRVQIIL